MSIRIQLNSRHPVYTNLDIISGTIILSLGREEPLTAVTVKLECESKTRLSAPRVDGRRQDIEYELHKLLYRTVTVFPTPQLVQAAAGMRSATYVLPAGEHQFPFQFKFPFNNSCTHSNSMLLTGQDMNRHVKKTLPPNLAGFPGEATIRYFIKATAQRTGIFKENYRQEIDLKFLPIEPPRPPPNKRESYARRQHQFSPVNPEFGGFLRNQQFSSGPPPRISVDGRLPDPPTLTAYEPIPLRVLIKKLNQTPEIVFLKNLHIVLVGFTKIRARDLERIEQNTWVLASSANLLIPIGNSNTPVDKDIELDNSLWANNPLPNSIAPTFETCNLSRWYELRVEVGLGWGVPGNIKSELSVQSLRMPVDVYSGIKPPAQLLTEMGLPSSTGPSQYSPTTSFQSVTSPGPSGSSTTPQIPVNHVQNQPSNIPQFQPTAPHDPEGPIDDPPPSYEDAIADSIPPVDGLRREYDQPADPQTPGATDPGQSTKGERLFGGG